MTATYLGIKGTRGMQEFLPNTSPIGAVNTCARCPRGFVYLHSNGNSTREAGQIQLRRRLHSGLTATLQYVFSKSIDDDSSLGGQGFSLTAKRLRIGQWVANSLTAAAQRYQRAKRRWRKTGSISARSAAVPTSINVIS